jgi:hypothetical protein
LSSLRLIAALSGPTRRIFAKNGGSAAVECKDMIENERKRKKMDMLYVGMAALIGVLTARALHFVDIHNSDPNTATEELR